MVILHQKNEAQRAEAFLLRVIWITEKKQHDQRHQLEIHAFEGFLLVSLVLLRKDVSESEQARGNRRGPPRLLSRQSPRVEEKRTRKRTLCDLCRDGDTIILYGVQKLGASSSGYPTSQKEEKNERERGHGDMRVGIVMFHLLRKRCSAKKSPTATKCRGRGSCGGIELSMSPRYVFSLGKRSDFDVCRDGDSYVGRDSDHTTQSFVKAVKVVLEGCGQLQRIVIHRSEFNDERLKDLGRDCDPTPQMVLECGRPSFSLASEEEEKKYKYPCRDGDYPPPAKTYSKRLLHEKEPDNDKVPRSRERQGASNSRCLLATCSRRAKDLTSMFVGMAVKVVLEGCGQLQRIVIHRSEFNDERLNRWTASGSLLQKAAARERVRQRQSVAVAGAVGGIELSMSPRYVFSLDEESDKNF
ncbi:unnamed protein product [Caenorhabditis auriculariae]|uniref:Uncharacterized protein n=1 Tax=Caenorhabditis auriculariae TaxID=2777116 RepID=A0A8S1HN27_9PELO|nr:unnamed protein product [Caenorhabditis auriculariae]